MEAALADLKAYERRAEETVNVPAPIETVFSAIDDPTRISTHMNRRSWMMFGSAMSTTVDERSGQAVGSQIQMTGRVLGMPVGLEEAITRREPPYVKQWATRGQPKLLVIGPYAITVELIPRSVGTSMRVAIDYDLPAKRRWLGKFFGRMYAEWCLRQIIRDATAHFVDGSSRRSGPVAGQEGTQHP